MSLEREAAELATAVGLELLKLAAKLLPGLDGKEKAHAFLDAEYAAVDRANDARERELLGPKP